MKHYSELIKRLYLINRFKGSRLGLETMQALDVALGRPSLSFPVIHIAGTNGKGSVAWKTAAVLKSQGRRVGLFTSPHIATFRERIRIDSMLVSEEEVAQGLERIFSVVDNRGIQPTFFEITTALAFLCFQKKQVDIAVVEAGIGGRLDATNIVKPLATAITSIAFDHCEVLGETCEQIAGEKAGIIKPGVPVVVGPTVPKSVALIAEERGAEFLSVEGSFNLIDQQNRAIAQVLCHVVGAKVQICDPALSVSPPLRQQELMVDGQQILIDVAHNPASLEALVERYRDEEVVFLLGLGRNKDTTGCLKALQGIKGRLFVTGGGHPRLQTAKELFTEAQAIGMDPTAVNGISEAVKKAQAVTGKKRLVIAGSFFMMPEVLVALGLAMESDPYTLNEVTPTQSPQRSVI